MLKLLVLAIILVSNVLSTSFEETIACLKGPSYWCENVSNANECGAFKHCLDTVWTLHTRYIDAKHDESCDKCIKCLNGDLDSCPEANEYHLNDITSLHMANLPKVTICKLINGCQKDEEVLNIELSSIKCNKIHPRAHCNNIDNALLCGKIDYCRDKIWSKLPSMVLSPYYETTDKTCGYCTWIFNNLHEILQSNKTEFNMKNYLTQACSMLPSNELENNCLKTINANFDHIYNMVRDSIDPGIICRVIKMCDDSHMIEKTHDVKKLVDKTTKKELLKEKLEKSNGVACELCSLIMEASKILIEKKENEDKINSLIIHQVCGRLGTLNSTCVEYIQTMGKQIMDDLIRGVDSAVICEKLGLCLRIQAVSSRFYDLNSRDNINCSLCKIAMMNVKHMLADNVSEERIISHLKTRICDHALNGSEVCKQVMNAYGHVVLKIISQDIQPAQLCKIIGLCANSDESFIQQETSTSLFEDEKSNNNNCVLCEFVISTLEKNIPKNSTMDQVEHALNFVCDKLPHTITGECKLFVNQYKGLITDLLINQIAPDHVCTLLGLCPAKEEVTTSIEASDPQCILCEYVITALTHKIHTNETGDEIRKVLDEICEKSPSKMRKECSQFVDKYGSYIVSLIINQVSSERICELMGLCVSNEQALGHVADTMDKHEIECIICEIVLISLKHELQRNDSEENIRSALNKMCLHLPKGLKDNCNFFVNTYGVYLVQVINEYVTPTRACDFLKMCPTSQQPQEISNSAIDLEVTYQQPFECSLCLHVDKMIVDYLKQNKTHDQVKQEAEKACNIFPSSINDRCKKLSDEYMEYLITLSIVQLEPENVCEELNYCKNTPELGNDHYNEQVKNTLKTYWPRKQNTHLQEIVKKPPQETFECTLCIYLSELASAYLKKNKTNDEIMKETKIACNFFPSPIRDQCNSFTEEYMPYILDLIENELESDEICRRLKLCKEPTSGKNADFRTLLRSIKPSKKQVV